MRKSFLLSGMLTIHLMGFVFASVLTVINYQGQLTDAGGNPVADGSYSITFTIYDDPTAGSVLWSSGVRQVDVTDGLFTYILGDSVVLFSSLFASDSNLWLGIQVATDPEMTPRSLLTSAGKSAISSGVFGDIKTSRGSMYLDDGAGNDSGVVISNEVRALDHHGHVTVLKISNNGSDTANMVGMYADDSLQSLFVGDDDGSDSGIVVGTTVEKHKHRGHVTILKIANNGGDTTGLVSMSATPDSQNLSMGDGNSPDSGIVLSNTASQLDHHGHVTVLKISNNGSDTANMVGMYADDEFQNIYVGDDDGSDSGIVVANSVDKHKHRGHVTILKISNNGADTTDLIGLYGDPVSPSMVIGDYDATDSTIIVTNAVDQSRHRGHVTILKISNSGADTTDIISLNGDENQASIQLNGGGGSGGSIYLLADSSSASGQIGVNNNSPTYEVDVVGTICATGGLCAPSDVRLKKDIESFSGGLSIVQSLNPVQYNWRREEFPERKFSADNQIGFIAQDFQRILPELVSQGTDGFYSLDYSKLTPVLVQAIKEQQSEIESLTLRLEQLEQMMSALTNVKASGSPELGLK